MPNPLMQDFFMAFSTGELLSGGPDPQVLLTARATDDVDDLTAAWRAGAFVNPYTCGAAAAIWLLGPASETEFQTWLEAHRNGLPTRRERRSVWNFAKMAQAQATWMDWVSFTLPEVSQEPYPVVYDSVRREVKYFGRYATMKVLEVLYQRGLIANGQTDIRPDGAKYPRRMLGMLFPEFKDEVDNKSNKPNTFEFINALATEFKDWTGLDITWFQFETLLCNSRQALAGKYPGRSQDRELAHWVRAEGYWGTQLRKVFPFYDLRNDLFDSQWLGEQGDPPWYAAREELEGVWKQRGENVL